MNNILICNIGRSDLGGEAVLSQFRGLSERERAVRILDHFSDYQAQLTLPIIGKALAHVQRQPGTVQQLVLVASDQGAQPPDHADARKEWGQDTLYTAQVVRRLLQAGAADWRAVPGDQVAIWLITDAQGAGCDPSDYDEVRRFFERRLPALQSSIAEQTVYLEVTGGTPAMTTGLLVAGTEVFGARAEVLYVHPHHPLPSTLNTGKRLQAGPLRSALRSNVRTYDYAAALRGFRDQQEIISDRLAAGAPQLLEHLLEYAHCRFNFDFRGARHVLEDGVDRLGDGRWRTKVMTLYQNVAQPDRRAKLAEVYYAAAARYEVGAYADFLTQLMRFQENALRMLCLDRGAQFVDWRENINPDGGQLQREWANSVGFRGRSDRLDRKVLSDIVQHLARQRGEDVSAQLVALKRLDGLASLRNRLTHTFEGVSQKDLAEGFAGKGAPEAQANSIVPQLAQICTLLTGQAIGESPFSILNTLIFELLREATS